MCKCNKEPDRVQGVTKRTNKKDHATYERVRMTIDRMRMVDV